MKKILLSSVALVGLTAGAFAADLPSRRMAPAPYVAVPVFTWTGFYVGVNAGYGFSDSNNDNNNTFGTFGSGTFVPAGTFAATPATTGFVNPIFGTGTNNDNNGGFVGGGQIGYNYQVGQVVFGVEADIQYADFGRDRNNIFGAGTLGGPATATFTPFAGSPGAPAGYVPQFSDTRNNIEWFGTVRGRLGYAWDRALLYATGGFAYGGGGNNNRNNFVGFNTFNNNNDDDIRGGYVVGGGLEYAFTNNWTAKIEGLYVSLDRDRNSSYVGYLAAGSPGAIAQSAAGATTNIPVFTANTRKNDDDFAVVRVGLNYKFW